MIPAEAIVARYRDESEYVTELVGNTTYVSFYSTCYWYYEGSTHSFVESAVSDKMDWNLEVIAEIKMKEFKKGNWANTGNYD